MTPRPPRRGPGEGPAPGDPPMTLAGFQALIEEVYGDRDRALHQFVGYALFGNLHDFVKNLCSLHSALAFIRCPCRNGYSKQNKHRKQSR